MDAERSQLLTADFVRVWLATLGAFASFGVMVLALPLYAKTTRSRLGRDRHRVGAASVTSIIFSILSGRLADRRGRRPLLLAGASVMVACYLALALTPGMGAVIAIRLVAGAAEATFVVGAYTVIADIAPEDRRGEAMSLVTLASYIGLTIGPLLADVVLGGDRFAASGSSTRGLPRLAHDDPHVPRDEATVDLPQPRPAGFRHAALSSPGCSSCSGCSASAASDLRGSLRP